MTPICLISFSALNEALKQEVERMRVETGEIASNNSDAYDMGMHHVHYNNQSSFFSNQSLSSRQMMQQQQQQQRFDNFQSNNNMAHQHRMITGAHAQDPIGCFQGLDIKSEGPSASSASESSATGFS
jgi:2-hydroxy-3-keto-5-methylthiopentenyl-1-phosphate phosphatase